MAKDPSGDILDTIDFPRASFDDLRGRQSVRATFKLTNDCIEAISIVAGQLGIKQKSLFDHLFQDTETLSAIGRKFRNARLQAANRIQKTYVMSRTSPFESGGHCQSFQTRHGTRSLKFPFIACCPSSTKNAAATPSARPFLPKSSVTWKAGRKLLKEAYSELGEADRLTERLTAAMGIYESTYKQMVALMEKGKSIETFELEAFQKIRIVLKRIKKWSGLFLNMDLALTLNA